MIFFVGNDGTIINSVPSPVYQGSAGANNIYLVAPFAENLQATVAFKLPNGVWTERYPMTFTDKLSGIANRETGQDYCGWQFSLPNTITEYFGTVTVQFFFYSAQSKVVTPTSATSFTVGRGVPEVLPDTPTEDVYEQVLNIISSIQSDLKNGYFTARAIYAWNSEYAYGVNELVYYPNEGDFGVFLKSLIDNNTYDPYSGGILNTRYWRLITDFNILEELYGLKSYVEQAVTATKESANSASQSATTATSQATQAQKSALRAESSAQRVESATEYLEGVQSGEIAVPKAISDGNGKNIAEQFETIESYIPSGTSEENQLADKAFVNSSINNMAAFYITSNSDGDAFVTREDLLNATAFYSGGQERTPTQNDYAIVLEDESQPAGVDGKYPTTRYSYQGGTYPAGQWDFQYVVNNTSLTQAQVNAINSGITAELVDQIKEQKQLYSHNINIGSTRAICYIINDVKEEFTNETLCEWLIQNYGLYSTLDNAIPVSGKIQGGANGSFQIPVALGARPNTSTGKNQLRLIMTSSLNTQISSSGTDSPIVDKVKKL